MENLKQVSNKEKITDFLKSLGNKIDIDILYHVDIDNIDINDPFDSITEMLRDNDAFNIEIIYYSNAIEYLRENDNSLRYSVELAVSMGYELANINSELLASLLASENIMGQWNELETEITDFFNELED